MRAARYAPIIGLMAAASALAVDLTTIGTAHSRYLVNLGRVAGDTAFHGTLMPTGLYDFTSAGGNGAPWWHINDGINSDLALTPNTFRGENPDFFGYRFKWPVQRVSSIDFYNRTYLDGGTFAATPAVQYLDAVDGAWHTLTDVTWSPPYDPGFGAGNEIRAYQITIHQSPSAPIWGIRLLGDANPAGNIELDPTGFVGLAELVVHGELEINGLDLNRNLALGALPIANSWHPAPNANPLHLTDGDPFTEINTWGVLAEEDYLGVMFDRPRHGVGGVGMIMKWYGDGGLLDDGCFGTLRVEYTTDGLTWEEVPGLNKGRYTEDWLKLTFAWWGPETGYLFTFDQIDDVLGLRVIGKGYGRAAPPDVNGFLGAFEFEVFGRPRLAVDHDEDGDVDQNDYFAFEACATGPTIPQMDLGCQPKDFDGDGDVDSDDFGIFQRCFSGTDVAYDPNCELLP